MSPPPNKPQIIRQYKVLQRKIIEYSDGTQFSRRTDPRTRKVSSWVKVTADNAGPSSSTEEPKKLYLVLEKQSAGEPMHWSLFVCRGESVNAKGKVWQVTGDAVLMHYQHDEEIPHFQSESFYNSYTLNADLSQGQEELIEKAVGEEKPPQAKDQRSVQENCQGWTIRVLKRLQGDVVDEEQVQWIESELKQPLFR